MSSVDYPPRSNHLVRKTIYSPMVFLYRLIPNKYLVSADQSSRVLAIHLAPLIYSTHKSNFFLRRLGSINPICYTRCVVYLTGAGWNDISLVHSLLEFELCFLNMWKPHGLLEDRSWTCYQCTEPPLRKWQPQTNQTTHSGRESWYSNVLGAGAGAGVRSAFHTFLLFDAR